VSEEGRTIKRKKEGWEMETNKHKKTEGDKEKTKKNRRKRANKEKEEAILLAVCFFVYSARSSTLLFSETSV
jgi:hypothetical protein